MSMDSWFGYLVRRSAIQLASLDTCAADNVAESRSKYTPMTFIGLQACAVGVAIKTRDASREPSATGSFRSCTMSNVLVLPLEAGNRDRIAVRQLQPFDVGIELERGEIVAVTQAIHG